MSASMEAIYSKIVIHRILKSDLSTNEKYNILVDYHCNSNFYYDLLCDYSYLLANGESDLSLWISLNGKPHLSRSSVNIGDTHVLEPQLAPRFDGDLINCLNMIFNNLSRVQPMC